MHIFILRQIFAKILYPFAYGYIDPEIFRIKKLSLVSFLHSPITSRVSIDLPSENINY